MLSALPVLLPIDIYRTSIAVVSKGCLHIHKASLFQLQSTVS